MSSEQAVLNCQWNAAVDEGEGAHRRMKWAVVLGARIFRDGDYWCALYGKDIMEGVCGFGSTPEEAIEGFELAMRTETPALDKIGGG